MKINNKLNKKYTLISLYVIATCIIIYILSAIVKNLPAITATIMTNLGRFMSITKPIIFGFVIAYLFEPVVNYLEGQFKKISIGKRKLKAPRTLGVLTTLLLFFLLIGGMISILVFTVTNQIRLASLDDLIILGDTYMKYFDDFYNSTLNRLSELNIQSEEIADYVSQASTYILNGLKDFAFSTVNSLKNISTYLTTFIFSLIIGVYFMIDSSLIKSYMGKVGRALFNDKWNRNFKIFITDADTVFSGYIRGQLTDAFIMMILISLVLALTGVKFGIIIGIFAGIGNLIPYCGPFIAYVGTILVCILNGDYSRLIIALILLLVIQTLDGNVIQPKLLSDSIEIHPVLVIIFLIFGNAVGGLLGMLLAVPVGALGKVLFVRYIDLRLKQREESEKVLGANREL